MNPTPGPWKLDPTLLHVGIPIPQAEEEAYGWIDMMDVYGYFLPDVPDQELESNARLIAAAPEMLALLEGMWEAYHDPTIYWHDKLIAVRDLVNKVKGE